MHYILDAIQEMERRTVVYWGSIERLAGFAQRCCVEKRLLPLPDFFCDAVGDFRESEILGVPILPPAELTEQAGCDETLILSGGLVDLQMEVMAHRLYYYPVYYCRSFETYFYLQEHSDLFEAAVALLSDESSKETYHACVQNIINGCLWNQSLYRPNAYWGNDIIGKLSDCERIVFAGAFDGKHIDRILENNNRVRVDAFEPSERWYAELSRRFVNVPNVCIHNQVLWNERTQLAFRFDPANDGVDARVCSDEIPQTDMVESITVDSLGGEKITLIALDVEGAEQKALRGAASTIRECKPKLAVCLYHSMDDYVEIPRLVHELGAGGYTLHVKQHSCVTPIETVLYAV